MSVLTIRALHSKGSRMNAYYLLRDLKHWALSCGWFVTVLSWVFEDSELGAHQEP